MNLHFGMTWKNWGKKFGIITLAMKLITDIIMFSKEQNQSYQQNTPDRRWNWSLSVTIKI
jgi:hypothetical protein